MSARQPTVTIPLAMFEQLMDSHYRQKGWVPPPHGTPAVQQEPESRVGDDDADGKGDPVLDLRGVESVMRHTPGGFDPSEYERVNPAPKVEHAGDA